jgi:tetratricopeptide (TPR) repeat protein
MNTSLHHAPAGPTAASRVSTAAAQATFALASLVALASTGCQGKLVRPSPAPEAPARVDKASTTGLVKSDFQSKVGPQQQYNVHIEMARVHESQGSNEAAIAEYQQALEVCDQKGSRLAGTTLGPAQQALAERRMAAAYDRMGRFAQAEVHYSKALKLAPADAKVWNDAGYSFYLQSRLDDAERSLKTAASIDPNNMRVQTNLGLALAAAGKTEESLAALSRAGGEAVGHANLGYILAAMGRKDEARKHYEAALGLQPDLAAARQALVAIDSQNTAPANALATTATAAPAASNVLRTSAPTPPAAPATATVAPTPIVLRDDVVAASATKRLVPTAAAIVPPAPVAIKRVEVVATPPPIELEMMTPPAPPSSPASASIPEWALPPSVRHDTPLYVDPTSISGGP